MNAAEFIAKWRKVELKERSAAQEHFLDLCRMLGHPTPAEADPTGETFCFEKGAEKHGGGWVGFSKTPERYHTCIVRHVKCLPPRPTGCVARRIGNIEVACPVRLQIGVTFSNGYFHAWQMPWRPHCG